MEEEDTTALTRKKKPLKLVDDDATWLLSGENSWKLFNMTNFDRDESVMNLARQLRGMGVMNLFARGAKDGD